MQIKGKNVTYLLLNEGGIGAVLVLICIIFVLFAPNFGSISNLSNILTQISINTVISIGMTFVILLGGIDLSVGSVIALCSIISGKVITNAGLPIWLAIFISIIVSILVGMLCGVFNGYVTEKWVIPSFVVTMGMLNIARGFALVISDSRTIFGFPDAFNSLGSANIAFIPVIFIIAILLVLLGNFVLKKTVYGRMIYAIGNNEEAVRLSGHNVRIYKISAYIICGGLTGIAAILYMMRLNISSPILGNGFELTAIAAVVIGGTSMTGGKGSMIGTLLGACILGVLNNGLLLIGLGDFARQIVTGFIIVFAVVLDSYRTKLISLSLGLSK
jgi:ribose transport system permease protein